MFGTIKVEDLSAHVVLTDKKGERVELQLENVTMQRIGLGATGDGKQWSILQFEGSLDTTRGVIQTPRLKGKSSHSRSARKAV